MTSNRNVARLATIASSIVLLSVLPAPAGQWFEEQTLEHDGLTRYYRYYVPDFQPASGYRLLFILHGGGGDMRSSLNNGAQAEWPEIADEEGILLVVPNGVNAETGDTAGNDQHWNDCRGDAPLVDTGADDVGYVSALTDWAIENFEVDESRIYSTGASNGGMMSYRLAFELGHRIAAIASFIANLPAASECFGPSYPVPVFVCNGDAEANYMPWEGGCVVANQEDCRRGTVVSALATRDFWIDFHHADPSPAESIDYPDLDPNDGSTVTSDRFDGGVQGSEVIFYRVRGGGHTTPSIEHRRDPLVLLLLGLGNQNHDVEGAREAWAFLERHTLHGTSPRTDPGSAGTLRVRRAPGETLELEWGPDCGVGSTYGVYRGDLLSGYDSLEPEPGLCDVASTAVTVPAGAGTADFFLVVPNTGVVEGSYGRGEDSQRPPSSSACHPQSAALDECADVGF